MKLRKIGKKANIAALPRFFQILLIVVVILGLVFIVLEKFLGTTTSGTLAYLAINQSQYDLYDYGVGFLGIIILVTMVYLIISIVSGGGGRGAR